MTLNLGQLTIIEIALVHFFKDIDISLAAGRQVQETIATVEYQIQELQTAITTQKTLNPIPTPKPKNS